jgi:hypothetical protein
MIKRRVTSVLKHISKFLSLNFYITKFPIYDIKFLTGFWKFLNSRKIVDEADDNTNISVLLNTILKLVSSIDVRLQGVEKSVGKFDEIKTIITSLSPKGEITPFLNIKSYRW